MADDQYNTSGFTHDSDGSVWSVTSYSGNADDYLQWDWKQIEAAILGGAAIPASSSNSNDRLLSISDPASLESAAMSFRQTQQIMQEVAQSIQSQAEALAGEHGPWTGDAASGFHTKMTEFADRIRAKATQIAGGASHINSVPAQLWNSAAYLRWAMDLVHRLDSYYAAVAAADGAPSTGNLVAVSADSVALAGLNRDMRAVMRSLVTQYGLTISSVVPVDTTANPNPNANVPNLNAPNAQDVPPLGTPPPPGLDGGPNVPTPDTSGLGASTPPPLGGPANLASTGGPADLKSLGDVPAPALPAMPGLNGSGIANSSSPGLPALGGPNLGGSGLGGLSAIPGLGALGGGLGALGGGKIGRSSQSGAPKGLADGMSGLGSAKSPSGLGVAGSEVPGLGSSKSPSGLGVAGSEVPGLGGTPGVSGTGVPGAGMPMMPGYGGGGAGAGTGAERPDSAALVSGDPSAWESTVPTGLGDPLAAEAPKVASAEWATGVPGMPMVPGPGAAGPAAAERPETASVLAGSSEPWEASDAVAAGDQVIDLPGMAEAPPVEGSQPGEQAMAGASWAGEAARPFARVVSDDRPPAEAGAGMSGSQELEQTRPEVAFPLPVLSFPRFGTRRRMSANERSEDAERDPQSAAAAGAPDDADPTASAAASLPPHAPLAPIPPIPPIPPILPVPPVPASAAGPPAAPLASSTVGRRVAVVRPENDEDLSAWDAPLGGLAGMLRAAKPRGDEGGQDGVLAVPERYRRRSTASSAPVITAPVLKCGSAVAPEPETEPDPPEDVGDEAEDAPAVKLLALDDAAWQGRGAPTGVLE